jgi:hypothetical protein
MSEDIGKFFCCSAAGSVLSCGAFTSLCGSAIFFHRCRRSHCWEENDCVEGNAYITVNKQVCVVSGDGLLMPSRKNQPGPDLRYFKQAGK